VSLDLRLIDDPFAPTPVPGAGEAGGKVAGLSLSRRGL